MKYCSRCLYPQNAKPYIIFDEMNLCSGCKVASKKLNVDWEDRFEKLKILSSKYKEIAKLNKSHWDCIIPVSGGKDSHYQVHIIKNVLGMNPLLVTYNHLFNSPLGTRNLRNLIEKIGCDNIRFSSSSESVKKLSRYMLKLCGDITWHYHAGILTYPIQVAVMYNIPLIVWGENDFSYLVGTFDPDDMNEFTRKHRKDFGLRGIEATDAIGHNGIEWGDIGPFMYPKDEDIERVGLKGIYLSNYIEWNERKNTEEMIKLYDFGTAKYPRERTLNLYSKLEDQTQALHDYLKYLKFGYGRGTDDASNLIRHGAITREEGIEYVKRYDHVRPRDLDVWLKFIGMKEDEFLGYIEPLIDTSIWERDENNKWITNDSIANHVNDKYVDEVRLPITDPNKQKYIDGKYYVEDPRWLLDYDGYVLL